ncbi:Uncharacterised protein [Mycobacteroides abscessus subsp. abscessus]|nr:Uncharacterised protein [Mycobacteroides abscessus subsp. abscessus]
MYALVRTRLPDAALVSIAHRSTVARWHDRFMRYDTRKGSDTTIRTGWLDEPDLRATSSASPR